jgi:glycosyltransferase involved in cell wall biosynthesis
MTPAVSVICTFLDAETTLAATLDSLSGQSLDEARFILVDDGSTDGSAAIAGSFCGRDSRFRLLRNPDPGRGRALNLGIAESGEEFVAVLDADDLAHPAWLKDGLASIRTRPEFAVVSFARVFIREDDRALWQSADEPDAMDVRNVTRELAHANAIPHSGAIMRRRSLVDLGGYDTTRWNLFDYDLWIRLAQSGRQLGLSQRVRIAKRYHDGQKFAHTKGYTVAAWREQFRAIMAIDRSYRNFLRLGLRVAADVTRRPRQTLPSGMQRR